ncbi:MAG: thermonuclease family protein [Proteobacteria bacterium]|nr:thermonuclease family protein [Pseudomonadota bacterium]
MIFRPMVILAVFLLILVSVADAREPFYGTVKKVIDGDSLIIISGEQNIEIRLYGIDAPEYKQPFAEEAKKYVRKWVGRQRLMVKPEYMDSYGRTVAVIVKADQVLNRDLVQAGMAWVYPRYCRKEACKAWMEMEEVARIEKRGLWFDLRPMSPWKWKRQGDVR